MISSSLLAFTFILITPLISATSQSPPSCSSSTIGQDLTEFVPAYTKFCSPDIVLNSTLKYTYFTYHPSNAAGCKKDDCFNAFESLVKACEFSNHTISGSGNTTFECGRYSFLVGAPPDPAGASTTVTADPSPTGKPEVGSTALGTSSANLVRISGSLIVGIAGIFVVFL